MQGGCVSTTVQQLSIMTRLTQLQIGSPDYQTACGSLQCLSALCQLRDLDVDVSDSCSATGVATVVPPLSFCTALTRLKWTLMPTQVHTKHELAMCLVPAGPILLSGLHADAHCHAPCPRLHSVLSNAGDHVYLQALLPCIAELSRLPLCELSLLYIQPFPDSAAFLALFQQLPQKLRQLLLTCGSSDMYDAVPAELLPRVPPPASLSNTALR